jgi:hypothetical protein
MKFHHVVAVLACLTAFPLPAFAECTGVLSRRVFASEHGNTYVRVDVDITGGSVARLYQVRDEGDVLVWTARLVNVPQTVWVDSGGRWIVTLGNYCNSPSDQEHALTVYDNAGQLIADWSLRELVPNLLDHVNRFEVHTPWTSSARLRFEAPFNELRVFFPWGESKVVNRPPPRAIAPERSGGAP